LPFGHIDPVTRFLNKTDEGGSFIGGGRFAAKGEVLVKGQVLKAKC
jgi:hypothetical protein